MASPKLVRRKNILAKLGVTEHAWRGSWSHDLGDSIVFDAWDHKWERDTHGHRTRYPLRTQHGHYNLIDLQQNPRAGHRRWQEHVELVLAGSRKPRAIVPVGNDTSSTKNKGAKGWLPVAVEGHVEHGNQGEVWLCVDKEVSL